MTDVDLNVVGNWLWGAFQKVSQAPLVVLEGHFQDLSAYTGTQLCQNNFCFQLYITLCIFVTQQLLRITKKCSLLYTV